MELGIYKHYKGRLYEALAIATHSETLEKLVVYKAAYQPEGENMWVRPLIMFTENIIIDHVSVPRFVKV